MNKIPLVDLKAQYGPIKGEIDDAIKFTLDNTSFIMGEALRNFEKEFASYCNSKHCVGVSSGTSALSIALKAAGIKKGDEIITSPHTFIATAEAAAELNAKVRFTDIDEGTYTIDPYNIEKEINEKTRAIMPIHLYGQPADMDHINEIAEKNNLVVIEDCAQAHGAEYKGKKMPFSKIGCFSFYPGKNLGAYGDAGAIVTNDDDVKDKAEMLINHGRMKGEKYTHEIVGFNHRLDTLQASILSVKLKHLDGWTSKRRANAKLYGDLLGNEVITPKETEYAKHVYHLYVVRVQHRDKLINFLKEKGISTGIHYPLPLHLQQALQSSEYDLGYKKGSFPITEKISKEVLSLPMFPELSKEEIEYITKKIQEGMENVV